MKFIDTITISVKAGKGGDGIVSFKAAKGKPRLGPDGGDGGTGGDVIFRGNTGVNTLSSLRYKALYRAEDGVKGGPNCCRGRCGEDLEITIPVGTVIRDADTGEIIGEVLSHGETIVAAKGGRHGLGNTHWATSTHQTPEEFRPGAPGEEKNLVLDLKLIADVGLAGFPNAGKSTLLSRLSAAKPKIADYPFTTLAPQLGVVEVETSRFNTESFVIADIPGLIEGASEGKGLGLKFLKHLERTAVIAYVIDLDNIVMTPAQALSILRSEMEKFSPLLANKPFLVILNKIDCSDKDYTEMVTKELLEFFENADIKRISQEMPQIVPVSGLSGHGLHELSRTLLSFVKDIRNNIQPCAEDSNTLTPVLNENFLPW
jgi:GTP-binding protein